MCAARAINEATRSAFLDGNSQPLGVADAGAVDDLARGRKNQCCDNLSSLCGDRRFQYRGAGRSRRRGWLRRLGRSAGPDPPRGAGRAFCVLAPAPGGVPGGAFGVGNPTLWGMRMKEIRVGQLEDALAMKPDLLTVFGGVNDVIAGPVNFDAIRADYVIIFGQARRQGVTVLTFTMPDPTAINPLGKYWRERAAKLNDIIRTEADNPRVRG